ncbi:MAG: hypothetical protein H6Q88_148 [Anaeromyxobacteraceae bacterium]|jgi:hypothetical protein|nr:hypothetical protein [Anaeromyxobacteraceae bacterium]
MSRRIFVGAAMAAMLGASCARVGPVSRPTPDGSARVYSVAGLSFEVPASWSADGNQRKVNLVSPGGEAVMEVKATTVAGTTADCLAGAGEALERGAASLSGVRRHPSTFAGRKAIAQEADQGGWHGWAWATCDRGEQYRIFLSGRAPVSRETIEVQRRLVATARLGGAP